MSDGTGANFWHSEFVEAQARCKQLERALTRAEYKLSAYVGVCKDDKELVNTVLPMCQAALSDTAQQPMTLCDSGGGSALFQKIAEDHQANMRERAAKLIRMMEPNGFDPRRFQDQIADTVEALPIDPETGGE